MAAITTRQTGGTGATVKNSPLTNAELDANFININTELASKAELPSQTNNNGRYLVTNGTNLVWSRRVTKSATTPQNPLEGDTWLDTGSGVWSMYLTAGDGVTSSGWVEIGR
jgi:hypothetical protein